MSFTNQYRQIMQPEARVARTAIKPRNVYRVSTYTGSKPITKTGDESRWIFVIGVVGDKIHCIRLNEIKPLDFTNFINKIRDKRTPITDDKLLSLFLKKFSTNGSDLFEQHIKGDSKIYPGGKSAYRIYMLEKIRYVFEIRFETGYLRELFGEINTPNTSQQQRVVQEKEIDEKDG